VGSISLIRNRRKGVDSLDALGLLFQGRSVEQKASNQVSLFGEGGQDCPTALCLREDWLRWSVDRKKHARLGFICLAIRLTDNMRALKRQGVDDIGRGHSEGRARPFVAAVCRDDLGQKQETNPARGIGSRLCKPS